MLLVQIVNCCFAHKTVCFANPPWGDFGGLDKTFSNIIFSALFKPVFMAVRSSLGWVDRSITNFRVSYKKHIS